MNSTTLGILFSTAILYLGMIMSSKDLLFFIDPLGLIIVLGGSLGLSLTCFPFSAIWGIFRAFLKKFLGGNVTRYEDVIIEIVMLARSTRGNPELLKAHAVDLKTFFIKDAIELLSRGGITDERFVTIMQKRATTFAKRYEDDVAMIKSISKFPVMLGFLGTIFNLLSPLQHLTSTESWSILGPAVAHSLIPLLYGLIITYFLLGPLSEKLSKLNREDATVREMVIDGMLLTSKKEHPILIEDHMKSFLLPSERQNLKRLAEQSS